MDIKIDQSAVQAVVQKAILDQLDSDQRDFLLATALEHLLKDRSSGTGYNAVTLPSVLQQAFNQAIEAVAKEVVIEYVAADPTIRDKVNALVGASILAMEEYGSPAIVAKKVAEALADVLIVKRPYD